MKQLPRIGLVALVVVSMLAGVVEVLHAQDAELAAVLEVIDTGVTIQRVGTSMWVEVNVESIVGAGDVIRTNTNGKVRITYFADGTFTELEPNTEYRIVDFSGTEERFALSVEVLAGIAVQQFARLLDPVSSYEVLTPGMAMTVRGTDFAVRVEEDGRSALLTFDGLVEADAAGNAAEINPGFGVRSAVAEELSAVVPATTFDELDAALDGCPTEFESEADVRLNVRVGPGLDYGRVGSVDIQAVSIAYGVDESSNWYRIPFSDGFGWVSSVPFEVRTCDELRRFTAEDADYVEDVGLYTRTGEVAELGVLSRVLARSATVNLRVGPGTAYDVQDLLDNGLELRIIGRNAEQTWFQVLLPDGRVGWVAAFLVESPIDINQYRVVPVETREAEDAPETDQDPTNDEAADG